jgi:hypothetical protein
MKEQMAPLVGQLKQQYGLTIKDFQKLRKLNQARKNKNS